MMSADSLGPIEVFYSYAQKDKALCDELEKHLGAIKRLDLIRDWHKRDIQIGIGWMQAVNAHLEISHRPSTGQTQVASQSTMTN